MIRLLILALGIFLIWVLFVSGFNKQRKILVSIIAIVIAITGLWFEQRGERLRADLITTSQLLDCGVSGKHSYRSNYDIQFCFQNNDQDSTVKNIEVSFSALRCREGDCQEIQAVDRHVRVELMPGTSKTLFENLRFDKVDPKALDIVWAVTPISVMATKKN